MAKLGWIGLGHIGSAMAMRLLDAGHELVAHDRDAARLEPATRRGARAARSAAEVAAQSEAVFLSLPNTDAVEAVVFGANGIAAGGKPGDMVVDTSSIHPERTRAMAARLRAGHRMGWVDAPVSGGPAAASEGALTAFLGGDDAEVARARPWVASFASHATALGPVGSGQIAKTCNQAIVCATIAAWSEVLDYAGRAGLDPEAVVAALAGGGADSAVRRVFAPVLAGGAFPGSMLMLKDLDILDDMARATSSPMPILDRVGALFRARKGAAAREDPSG